MVKVPVGEIVELAVLAEQMGYDRCWLYEEGVMPRVVIVTLAAIAGRPSTVEIGPGITNPYVRHPGSTAAAGEERHTAWSTGIARDEHEQQQIRAQLTFC